MQATNSLYKLNRTSAFDKWMLDDKSKLYLSRKDSILLSEMPWNSRIISAAALYFDALGFGPDNFAQRVLDDTVHIGDHAGQVAIAPAMQAINEMDSRGEDVPSSVLGRVLLYCMSIVWTSATPWSDDDRVPPLTNAVKNALPDECQKLIVSRYDDGDYDIGILHSEPEPLPQIAHEIRSFIGGAFADIDFNYYSSHAKAQEGAVQAKKYIFEKWGYEFKIENQG